jgi:hypothetical protein
MIAGLNGRAVAALRRLLSPAPVMWEPGLPADRLPDKGPDNVGREAVE